MVVVRTGNFMAVWRPTREKGDCLPPKRSNAGIVIGSYGQISSSYEDMVKDALTSVIQDRERRGQSPIFIVLHNVIHLTVPGKGFYTPDFVLNAAISGKPIVIEPHGERWLTPEYVKKLKKVAEEYDLHVILISHLMRDELKRRLASSGTKTAKEISMEDMLNAEECLRFLGGYWHIPQYDHGRIFLERKLHSLFSNAEEIGYSRLTEMAKHSAALPNSATVSSNSGSEAVINIPYSNVMNIAGMRRPKPK